MSKSNRAHFNPNAHQFPHTSAPVGGANVTTELKALTALVKTTQDAVRELRSLSRAVREFREDMHAAHALLTCTTLAIGDEDEQELIRKAIYDEPDEAKKTAADAAEHDTVKYALRTDFNMNEIMRAASTATDEAPSVVRKATEAIVAYLKRQLEKQTPAAKTFMDELDDAVFRRSLGSADPADFDTAVAVVKNALPAIVAAVSEATGIHRTVVDRIAFAELIEAKRVLVETSRVVSGEEAKRIMDELENGVDCDSDSGDVEG